MSDNDSKKVKYSSNTVSRIIDDEVVVLQPEGAMLHALTGCGSRIWEIIGEEKTIEEIVSSICDEYDVEPDKAKTEVTTFINRLIDMKIVEYVSSTDGKAG